MLTPNKIEFFKNKIQEVIDCVPGFKEFIFDFYLNEINLDFSDKVYSFARRNVKNYLKHNFLFSLGYSKLVLLIDEGAGFEYVVKFPFEKFHDCSLSEENYCEKELNTYKKVKEDCPEILDLFAECVSFEMEIENLRIPIYLMERVEVSEDLVTSCSDNCEEDYDTDILIDNFFYKMLPEERSFEYAMLCDFLDENDINDIHEGNVGVRKDWTPCIIDYSGYGY